MMVPQASAQTHLRQSHHDSEGCLLRNLEPHLNQAQQRACACKRCLNLNSPRTSEVIQNPCLQHQGLLACTGGGADFNGECRYGIHSSHWPAHVSPHVPAPQGPCHGIDPPHITRTPHANGMAMGAASAHGFTLVASRFSPLNRNQERDWKQNGLRMEASSKRSGSYGEPPNQVILYRWFLIRCSDSSQGVDVSVGGFLTPGTAGTERFKTAAIVQRIEKCRLLAYDGLEVLLAGLIDDFTTVSNGFSLDIVQGFLSGFPYTWDLLLKSELCASNPRHPNHHASRNCGLGGGVETSQLRFEGSDQEKRTLSPSFCDHSERADMQLNMKQTMTTEVQSEKEAATLKNNDSNAQPAMEGNEQLDTVSSRDDQVTNSNAQPAMEGSEQLDTISSRDDQVTNSNAQPAMKGSEQLDTISSRDDQVTNSNAQPAMEGSEQLDTIISRDDQVTNSNSTGLVAEQEMISVRTKETQQENAHVDQSTCTVKKRLGRASKTQPHVGSEDGTALTQIGAGNALPNKSNGSTESVEKSDKCGQKSQLTPRITRSMQKISRHVAHSDNVSVDINTRTHCDSLSNCEEVHTPVEHCGPCVKPISSTTASTIYQKRVDNKRSRRTLAKDSVSSHVERENIDGGKSSTISPCYYTEVRSPVEMVAQRPESLMNAEARESHSNHQKEACTLEAVQACDYGTADEEENVIASVQKSKGLASFKSKEKFTKTSQNELNKRDRNFLSKSPGQGSKCPKIRPPLPRPRAPVSKRLISAAFGLKTSRSGRLLVPPLAHWCSQALLRDKDGGILGISEGSKDMSKDGYLKFIPPSEAGLRKLQKRFCEVATDCTPRKKRVCNKKRQ